MKSKPTTKPGSRAAIEQAIGYYGLHVDSIKPGTERLYAVEIPHGAGMEHISDRMTFKELRTWTQGFIVAKEGRPSVHI